MLKQIMGTYIPSGFSIYLNKLPHNLNTRDATFVHEYTHFLQDIILPYCIRQNLVFVNNFAWISKMAEINQKLTRPFREWSDDCNLTFKQTSYTWGNGEAKDDSGKVIDIQSDFFISPYDHNIFRYNLKFEDGTQYQFGARDFLEYLAHKIENKFWKTNAPDLPYRTVDKVFDYYSLGFIPEAVRLLIVEYCLYNDNPVHLLMNMFINQNLIMNHKDKFCDYDVCLQYLLGISWQSRGGFDESILTKTERRLNDFRERLSSLYPHRQYNSIREWILTTNNFCKNELSNRFIISSLYNISCNELYDFIDRLVNTVGIPVIKFADNTVASMLPSRYNSDQFLEFYIISKFMEWISTNERYCPIYNICNKNFGLCQKICCTNPVIYSGECKFKLFLKSYGFDTLTFEYND